MSQGCGQIHVLLTTYRVLFPKRVGGKHDDEYAGLDFGHFVDLAGIDQELRGLLLPITLDVEGAAKAKLVEKITEDPDEDGYSVFADYLAHLNHADRTRRQVAARLLLLESRATEHGCWYEKNTVLVSSYRFLDKALRSMVE